MDSIENHKLGFALFTVDDGYQVQVQKIDDPESWQQEFGYDFKIPLLPSNEAAWIIATHNGFILTDQGFVLAKLNKNVVL